MSEIERLTELQAEWNKAPERERRRITLEEFEEMCSRLSEYTRVHGVTGLVATVDEGAG